MKLPPVRGPQTQINHVLICSNYRWSGGIIEGCNINNNIIEIKHLISNFVILVKT